MKHHRAPCHILLPSLGLIAAVAGCAGRQSSDRAVVVAPPAGAPVPAPIAASAPGGEALFPQLRVELHCDRRHGPPGSRACYVTKETDKQTLEKAMGGEPGKLYQVKLRVRGVVEPMRYAEGTRTGDWFYEGGEPNDKQYNVYKLQVADPPRHYFFNAGDPPPLDHDVYPVDYQVTITVKGGSKLVLSVDGQNASMIENAFYKKLEGVEPYPRAFPGQFLQIDAVEVSPAPATSGS
jgi:hypothetical protein